MAFFQTFWAWLNQTLTGYIGDNTARVAAAIEPAIVTLSTIYVMLWGYLHLTGRVEEPIAAGLKRFVLLAIVLGVSLRLWLYNSLIVDTFYDAPAQLAAAIVGSADPVSTIDAIWQQGGAVAEALYNRGALTLGFGSTVAGLVVYVLIGMLCVYAMFLIALSSVASSVLLAIGPLFIALLLFDATRRYFEAWIAQLVTYALISVLTVLVSALMLHVVETYAEQTAALGPGLHTVDALDTILVAMVAFLLLRQIMPIASALAGGLALNTFGAVSRSLDSMLRSGRRSSSDGMTLAVKTLLVGELRVTPAGAERSGAATPSWRDR